MGGLQIVRSQVAAEAARAAKVEKQLAVKLGGYQRRAGDLARQLTDAATQRDHAAIEHASFAELAAMERTGLAERLARLEGEVGRQRAREATLQQRYADLVLDWRQRVQG
jgi:pre-mRNA-splicing factor CDC5/CEF1